MPERVRSQSFSEPSQAIVPMYGIQGTTQHGYGSDPDPLPSGSVPGQIITQTTTDVTTPGYHDRINRGEIINSPFRSVTQVTSGYHFGTFDHIFYKKNGKSCNLHNPSQTHDLYYRYKGNFHVCGHSSAGGHLAMDSSLRSSKIAQVVDEAVLQSHANIDVSEMMALASAAESRKTIDSVAAILLRAYKIGRNVKRLNLKGLRNELSPKELADRYMEARYAIRPLMYDARGIARAIRKERRYERRTFRGQAETSYTQEVLTNNVAANYLTVTDFKRTLDYKVSARAGVLCDVAVTEASVFGMDKVVETAWELTPFSFIIDWFVNVGDWIAAYTPNAGVNQRASWVTYREELRTTIQAVQQRSIASSSGFVNVSLTSPLGSVHKEELVLERIVDPAIASFPAVAIHLDAYKLTDLTIILKNLFR